MLHSVSYKFGDEAERLQIFHDVRLLVGDDEDVQQFNRLVYIPHVLCLDERVLAAGPDQLRERRQQALDPQLGHRDELPRNEHYPRYVITSLHTPPIDASRTFPGLRDDRGR